MNYLSFDAWFTVSATKLTTVAVLCSFLKRHYSIVRILYFVVRILYFVIKSILIKFRRCHSESPWAVRNGSGLISFTIY